MTSDVKKSVMTNKPADRTNTELMNSEECEDLVATTLLMGKPRKTSVQYHKRADSFVKQRDGFSATAFKTPKKSDVNIFL